MYVQNMCAMVVIDGMGARADRKVSRRRLHRLQMETTQPPDRGVPWHRQPLKALYLTYQFGALFLFCVPFWAIKFIWRSQRPSPTRSWLNSVVINVVRNVIRIGTHAGVLQSRRDVTELPSVEQVRRAAGSSCKAVWIEPIKTDEVWGDVKTLMVQNDVTPARVAAFWLGDGVGDGPVKRAEPDEKVLVHFHGGGYVVRRRVGRASFTTRLA